MLLRGVEMYTDVRRPLGVSQIRSIIGIFVDNIFKPLYDIIINAFISVRMIFILNEITNEISKSYITELSFYAGFS